MEIKFDEVFFSYNPKSKIEKEVLKNINIDIKPSKISSIIGKSGSGKSTLVEMINALNYPTKGTLKINEFIIDSNSKRKIKNINNLRINVGLVFQFPEEQFFNMTVYDEIKFGMTYFKYQTKDMKKRVIDSLKMVGMDKSFMDRNPFALSSGEKRKIAIASILAFNPSIVILDEPTIGLDSISKKNLIHLIRTLKTRYKKTIIIISHDIELVHQISDYVYVLNDGKIVLEGEKFELFKNEKKLKEYGIDCPKAIKFSNLVYEKKGIKIGYRDNINDIIKDVYRNVR
ncbi:MAG: ATP-binding cassette domain-containing protein [Bacilli bacterium]